MIFQNKKDELSADMKEKLDEVGFTYYLILARMHDIDPKLATSAGILLYTTLY